MNQKELIDKIDNIETYQELIEINKLLREQILINGFDYFDNFHEIYQHLINKQNLLRIKFNINLSKFLW